MHGFQLQSLTSTVYWSFGQRNSNRAKRLYEIRLIQYEKNESRIYFSREQRITTFYGKYLLPT
jgi:hypothetical protein